MLAIILTIAITAFEPETSLVRYAGRSAWLGYPGQYPVSICRDVVVYLGWFSDYGAYACYAIWYGRRDRHPAGDVRWLDFENIFYVRGRYPSRPSIAAVRGSRFFFAAWDGRDGPYRIFLLRAEGVRTYLDIISSDTLHSFTPSIHLDTDTTLHIVWQGWTNILYKNFEHGQFSPTITLSESPYAINPTITSFGDRIAVAWSALKKGSLFDIYIRIFDGEWQEEIRVTSSPGSSRFPVIAYDNTGILHIAYMDNREGGFDIYHTRFDGESLTETLEVSSPGDAIYPSITTTPDGRVHLAWADDRDGNYEIYYKIVGEEKIERMTYATGSSSYPVIVSDVAGGLWLFYQDRRNVYGEIFYRTSPPSKERVREFASPIVYPNPAMGKIDLSEPVRVYDIAGRYIGTHKGSITLSPGIYFLLSEKTVQKLVVITQ